jgi:hypothetical protein
MKQILYFLIGVLISFISYSLSYADANHGSYCTRAEAESVLYDAMGFVCSDCEFYEEPIDSNGLIKMHYYSGGYTLEEVLSRQTHFAKYVDSQAGCYYLGCSGCNTWGDSDADGIPDGLDAYPDSDSFYQFRIMTNYFDAQGNCVAQLIVTSDGDYVLLGDLTTAEIEAGLSAGTYKSTFVNSPNWINSTDLKEDNAKDIYANGPSTKDVTSTDAGRLNDQASQGTKAGTPTTGDAPPLNRIRRW